MGGSRLDWVEAGLIALTIEKIVQHTLVSFAFYFNWGDIASSVAVDPALLMVSGALVAVLFALSLWGQLARKRWAVNLVILLAVFDLLGEFIAQGKISITITVSFLVALLLLGLALACRRRHGRPGPG